MTLPRSKLAVVVLASIGNLLVAALPAQAALLGDTINAAGTSLAPASAVIGGGVEFTGFGGISFDFGASTLTLSSNNFVGLTEVGNYVFSGFDQTITGLSISSNSGFFQAIVENYSFTSNSITLDMTGIVSPPLGAPLAQLVFNIEQGSPTAVVAEPASLLLIGLGLLGLGYIRRPTKT